MKRIRIFRKKAIGIFGLFLCFQAMGQAPIADGKEKWIGNIYSGSQLFDFTSYWNQVTPENAGKWGSVEASRDVFNWSQLDAAYNLAKENGFPFRFHVLIWGNQQPGWIAALSEEEQLEEITEWMDAVAERYPDIDYLEVVNEPLHDAPFGADNGGYGGALGGSGTSGWDWVVEAFRMARERFPDAQLVLNDYNIVSSESNVNRYLRIIELLQQEDLIDVIGVQAHAFSTRGSAESMKANLDLLAETGLPIMATEMDIDGVDASGNVDDDVQLEDMQRIFPVFWEHPAVMGITFWGWRPGLWRNAEAAYLINTQGLERPALEWLRTYVERSNNVLSVNEAEAIRLQVYPNPVTDHTIQIQSDSRIREVEIINAYGKQVQQIRLSGFAYPEIRLDRSISPGIYLLKISYGNSNSLFRRLIIA
ncbi:MAG: endo-1,4-beta-xylanase [Cyclobacteriaceae bacterium]